MMIVLTEVDEVLTRHGASVTDLLTVADRLLVTAFRNIGEQQPDIDQATLCDNTLAQIRRHILQPTPAIIPES